MELFPKRVNGSAESRQLFSQKAPSNMFDKALNKLCNVKFVEIHFSIMIHDKRFNITIHENSPFFSFLRATLAHVRQLLIKSNVSQCYEPK